VTRTVSVPTDAKLQERLAAPDPVTLDGVMVQEVLFDDKLTAAANPFRPLTAMVDVPAEPTLTVTVAGLADIEKSWAVNVTVMVRDRELLVPVTPT
jgi:hypothetical protein